MAGCVSPFRPVCWFARLGLTENLFPLCLEPAAKQVGNSLRFFLIRAGRCCFSTSPFLWPLRPAKKALLCPPPRPALRAPPCNFLVWAWTSGSPAVYSLRNPNPPRKASGSLTDAETKHSLSLGAGRPRTTAPHSPYEGPDRGRNSWA